MSYLHAFILAIVEGLTEFLPVSSTFHLLQTAQMLGVEQTEFTKLFEVFVQSGAVFAVFFVFSKQIWTLNKNYIKLIVATAPILGIGFVLRSFIKGTLFENPQFLLYIFGGVGVLFVVVECWVSRHSYRQVKTVAGITILEAVLIGLAQSLAVFPGVSRSGSVIIAMLLLKYKREEAAVFSLLLSVPTIFAASAYDLYKTTKEVGVSTISANFDILVLGFVVSFVVGYFAARFMVKFLRTRSLAVFGVYRIIVAAILIFLSVFKFS